MGLRDEIVAYTDGNGLVCPQPAANGVQQGSDNGVMFTSEYYILLAKRGELTQADRLTYLHLIDTCIREGILCRAPGDLDQEGPDDYYGVFAAATVLGSFIFGSVLLNAILNHKGFLNNHDNTRTWQSFLIRQPQLLAASYAAAGRAPVASWPLYWYAAFVIATSCINAPKEDADARRLSWLLIQAVTTQSFLCRLASKLWYRRLHKTYPNGMKDVASLYYAPGHPFIKYWVD